MENLRWILIFAGVAILVLLYFSGRSTSSRAGNRGRNEDALRDPLDAPARSQAFRAPEALHRDDPLMDRGPGTSRAAPRLPDDLTPDFDGFEVDPQDLERPAAPRAPHDFEAPATDFDDMRSRLPAGQGPYDAYSDEHATSGYAAGADGGMPPMNARFDEGDSYQNDYGDLRGDDRVAARLDGGPGVHGSASDSTSDAGRRGQQANAHGHTRADTQVGTEADSRADIRADIQGSGTPTSALGGLSQKFGALGARFSSRRTERQPEDNRLEDVPTNPDYTDKIVTLHVVAREEGVFDGQTLIDCFESRGLEFGEMNIFHSMHHDKSVFSIAKAVEPGWFDPHDLDSFTTPGITLILQLPGPVAADTAFEVLLTEAAEIAAELDGRVLDGDRSTLSKQAAQHMREGIYEYMHRQKYFGSVTS